jgi:phage terminase large subunit
MNTDLDSTLRAAERTLYTKHRRFEYLGLSTKQSEALAVLTDTSTVELLYGGGANGGKSWLGCTWLAENCRHYPGTRWFIGRENLKDIRGSTYETWKKVCRKIGIGKTEWKFNGQDNFILFANGSRIDFVDCKYLPHQDPDFERLGSYEYTGGWIEEGGQIVEKAYEILRSRIGRNLNDKFGIIRKLLITCNPKRNWIFNNFIKPMREGVLPAMRKFIQSLVDDNTYAESGARDNLESLRSETDRRRLLLGDWDYEDDPGMLTDYETLIDMFTNEHVKNKSGEKYITADIARYGKDKTRIGVWIGAQLAEVVTLSQSSVPNTAKKVQEIEKKYGIRRSCVCIDDDGVGGGVADLLPGCVPFVNGSRPIDRPGDNSSNLKSQCGFEIADRINAGDIYVTCGTDDRQEIVDDLLAMLRQRNVDSEGKKSLVSKEEVKQALGRSPDLGDMVLMRGYFFLKPQIKSTMKRRMINTQQ